MSGRLSRIICVVFKGQKRGRPRTRSNDSVRDDTGFPLITSKRCPLGSRNWRWGDFPEDNERSEWSKSISQVSKSMVSLARLGNFAEKKVYSYFAPAFE